MKFGKDLQSAIRSEWAEHYIDYKQLKQRLKAAATATPARSDIDTFIKYYHEELKKVNSFFLQKTKEFSDQLDILDAEDDNKDHRRFSDVARKEDHAILKEICEFQTYVWINSQGFKKAIKKMDKRFGLRETAQEMYYEKERELQNEVFVKSTKLDACLDRARMRKKRHNVVSMELKLLAGSANRELAEEIAGRVGLPLTRSNMGRFNDGETNIKIDESVRNSEVFIIQPTCTPVNDNLMELLLCISALKRASAAKVVAVVPYYGYARQDRKDKSRVPISAADVARMLEAMGVDRVVCIDLHCGQIQGFFGPGTPMDNLQFGPVALQYFLSKKDLKDPVVVSPDAGGVLRAKVFKDGLCAAGMVASMAMIIKQREAAGVVGQMDLVGTVEGCDVIIVDDMIDTAGTLAAAANELKRFGAINVYAFATHGLFNGNAAEKIEKSALAEVVVSNTIPLRPEVASVTRKIRQLSVAKLLAQTILNIHSGESVGAMFLNHLPASMYCEHKEAGGASSRPSTELKSPTVSRPSLSRPATQSPLLP